MDNKTTGVETTVATAPATTEVKKTDTSASGVEANDLLAVIADLDAQLAKKSSDAENYRKGMLLAKGKSADESEETVEEKVERLVNEKILNSDVMKLQAQKDQIIKDALKRNSELELAFKNKGQISTGASATADTTAPAKTNYFSDDQIKALKAKGWDDKKIERLMGNVNKMKGKSL